MHEEAFRLLTRISPRYRAVITAVELRLGPGWHKPARGWVVDPRLGLSDTVKLRLLKIFVECDPESHEVFDGFRTSQFSYAKFCVNLARGLLTQVPSVSDVEFDGYPSISKSSPLLQGLFDEVEANSKQITWGPERAQSWGA
ncbi:hypothetical protein K469DRAFT_738498 [Zopfia rhizophila CBS 207.26]|uniref:Uncharacterized protein n=1 Tax=Zopfia rhizophila CBS 207.26 TaxID=1314779 RepID=A0A6A6E9A6_9PEZI|nr:hypothetical protein K469DRAFT_738498 [Zopfia rhizophila CBS 207.26]